MNKIPAQKQKKDFQLSSKDMVINDIFEEESAELVDFNKIASNLCKQITKVSISIQDSLPCLFINQTRAKLLFSTIFAASSCIELNKLYLTCSKTSKSWKFTISSHPKNKRHKRLNNIPDTLRVAQDIISFYEGKLWLQEVNNKITGICFSLPILK